MRPFFIASLFFFGLTMAAPVQDVTDDVRLVQDVTDGVSYSELGRWLSEYITNAHTINSFLTL